MASQRIIVVGGVAAGPAAGAEAKRVDPQAEVLLFERGPRISYGACEMPYLLTGQVAKADDLVVLTPEEMFRTRGVRALTLHNVERVDLAARKLTVTDRVTGLTRQERYDKLILATGARVAWPGIEGLEGDRVHAFRTLEDAERVSAIAADGRLRWVILGGGFIGVEVADRLAVAGHRVTLLAPGGVLPDLLCPELSGVVESALLEAGVSVRKARATGLRRDAPGAPVAVRSDDGQLIGADHIVVATGIVPEVSLATGAGLKIGRFGGIRTGPGMRTSNSLVWACGDCVEVSHLVTGEPAYIPLSPLAFRSARVAGRNAARSGRHRAASLAGSVGAYAVKVAGLEVAGVGLTSEQAQSAGFHPAHVTISHGSKAGRMQGSTRLRVHLVFDTNSRRLLGGQLVGADGAGLRANVLVPLLRARATVDDLLDQDLVYTPPIAPSLDPLLVAARAAQKKLDNG